MDVGGRVAGMTEAYRRKPAKRDENTAGCRRIAYPGTIIVE